LLFLKSDDLLYILKKLAYWIHTQGSTGETEGGTLIDKEELIRWLRREIQTLKKCEAHEAKGEAERFIDFIQRRTGLLNEQGRDRYAFVHKTFQEYLTAEEIFDRADVEDDTEIILAHFRQHLHDQHWREVLLLLVSKLKGKKAQKAIQAVLDAGGEYEQWLHRDLVFAGWCLTEDPPELTVAAGDLVGVILDRLVGLEVEKSDRIGSKIRDEVEKILHCLAETTLERVSLEKLQAQGDRICHFRLLKFQAVFGQEAEVIDKLLFLMSNTNSHELSRVMHTLGQLRNTSPDVMKGLLSLLGDENSDVRLSAAEALVQSGNTSPDVMNGLLSLIGDEHLFVSSRVLRILVDVGKERLDVMNILLSWLSDDHSYKRFFAAEELGRLGNTNPEVMNCLLSLLNDKDSSVCASAASALVRLGNVIPKIVSVLLCLLCHENSTTRSIAAAALGRSGNTSLEVINSLHTLQCDESLDVLCSVAIALVQLGEEHSAVVSSLFRLLGSKRLDVRSTASGALLQLAKTSDTISPKVVQWLEQNRDEDGIGDAIDCLWSIVVE
jgi:hypothetical protein